MKPTYYCCYTLSTEESKLTHHRERERASASRCSFGPFRSTPDGMPQYRTSYTTTVGKHVRPQSGGIKLNPHTAILLLLPRANVRKQITSESSPSSSSKSWSVVRPTVSQITGRTGILEREKEAFPNRPSDPVCVGTRSSFRTILDLQQQHVRVCVCACAGVCLPESPAMCLQHTCPSSHSLLFLCTAAAAAAPAEKALAMPPSLGPTQQQHTRH